jgi:pyrroloquinoline quinone (PQQ) biosynthesis protein C
MFKMVADAQRWTAAAYVAAEDQKVRQRMLRSMYEEETGELTGTDSHSELLADWLEALGQSRPETYERAKLLKPHFQAWCDHSEFLGRCRPFWLFRGSISLAGEAHAPAAFRTIVKAMQEHYGMTDEKALKFYTLHIPVDEEHTDNAVWIVKPFLTSEENRTLLRHYVFAHMEFRYRAWMEPLGEIGYSLR